MTEVGGGGERERDSAREEHGEGEDDNEERTTFEREREIDDDERVAGREGECVRGRKRERRFILLALLTRETKEVHAPLYNDVTVPAAVWKGNHRETPCVRSVKEQSRRELVTRSDRYARTAKKGNQSGRGARTVAYRLLYRTKWMSRKMVTAERVRSTSRCSWSSALGTAGPSHGEGGERRLGVVVVISSSPLYSWAMADAVV